jgi:hypothetical protein
MNKIGKLIKTLKDVCPDCGTLLQLRAIQYSQLDEGEEVIREKKIKYCHHCESQEEIRGKMALKNDYGY